MTLSLSPAHVAKQVQANPHVASPIDLLWNSHQKVSSYDVVIGLGRKRRTLGGTELPAVVQANGQVRRDSYGLFT